MRPYERAGIEPDFQELLADPILHAVMARDGITEETVRAVLAGDALGLPTTLRELVLNRVGSLPAAAQLVDRKSVV